MKRAATEVGAWVSAVNEQAFGMRGGVGAELTEYPDVYANYDAEVDLDRKVERSRRQVSTSAQSAQVAYLGPVLTMPLFTKE